MQNFSLHTHTIGFDGRNTEEEMLQKAEKLGLKTIGFSNHFIVYPTIKEAKMYQYALKDGYDAIYASSFVEAINRFRPHYAIIDKLREKTNIKIQRAWKLIFFLLKNGGRLSGCLKNIKARLSHWFCTLY